MRHLRSVRRSFSMERWTLGQSTRERRSVSPLFGKIVLRMWGIVSRNTGNRSTIEVEGLQPV